ncbi:putative 54S ribosomal protein L17, mitochondrial [Hyaloscypha finlandica]|nr:putative 54S ribosomal protein L17, mitochondrial [Hyaloscypha finlandica]
MTASSRGSRAAASVLPASLKTLDNTPNSELPHVKATPPVTASTPHHTTKAGILLTRPPLLTPPLTSFEKAYFFYQKRLNERLALPFTRYFYFKKDTPADTDWKIKARERNGVAARELGGYRAYGEEAWNDELLVTDLEQEGGEGEGKSKGKGLGKMGLAEPKHVVDSLVKEARVRAIEGKDGAAVEVQEGDAVHVESNVDQPLKRWTDADRKRDVRRLDRQLARTLYLLVKREGGGWGFPAGELVGRENLHQGAERVLVQTAGVNMNTWIVGHVPVAHHIINPRFHPESGDLEKQGTRTFFMKGRIMAGQANLEGNMFGLSDFKWLTKQEVQKHVADKYWSYVKNMMSDR